MDLAAVVARRLDPHDAFAFGEGGRAEFLENANDLFAFDCADAQTRSVALQS